MNPFQRGRLAFALAGNLVVSAGCLIGTAPLRAESPKVSPPGFDTRPTLVFSQPKDQPLHLVVYGDSRFTDPAVTSGTNPRVRKWLAERIGEEKPQAVLLTGDTPFKGAIAADWQDFQNETASWRAAHSIQLPATGNHELYGGARAGIANYLKNFPDISGRRYYSALLGSIEVISLDCTQPANDSSPQGRWFAAQLDHLPAQVDFLLILYHMPWMADTQSEIFVGLPTKDAVSLRSILEVRLKKIRAKVLVFNGHIHNYERFERLGVEYVITGGGGAEPYPLVFRGDGDLYRDTAFPVYHYLTLDISNHQLHATMWKVRDPAADVLEVQLKDQFTMKNTAPARGDRGGRPPSRKPASTQVR